jgi:hypothetical protein
MQVYGDMPVMSKNFKHSVVKYGTYITLHRTVIFEIYIGKTVIK